MYRSDNIESSVEVTWAEQVDLLHGQTTWTLLFAAFVAVALGVAHREVLSPHYTPWLLTFLALTAVRIYMSTRYRAHRARGAEPDLDRWVTPYLIGTGLNGVVWGLGFGLLFTPSDPALLALLLVTLAGIVGGGAIALSSIRAGPATFIMPICAIVAFTLFSEGSEISDWLGLAALVYSGFMLRLGYRSYQTTLSSLLLRHENETLLHQVERAKAETDTLNRELAAANDEALHALDAKSAFLATMSHEIRTPMNGVLGMAELLQKEPLNRRQHHLARTLYRSGEALLGVINDTLDYSRIESDHFELDAVPFSMHDILEDVVELLAPTAHAKGVGVTLVVPAAIPTALIGDPGRLRQVCMNIVGNAIKFTEQGEVSICAELDEAPAAGRVALRISVSDTGTGISEDAQAHIFEAFAQESSATARRFGGTGLGLAISRQLIELMGGTISAHSQPGAGSTFTVCVELDIAPLNATLNATLSDIDAFRGLGVVIASANAGVREGLVQVLLGLRAPHASYSSGRESLAAIRDGAIGDAPIRLLVVDESLDDTSGVELLASVAAEPIPHSIDVFLLCTSAMQTSSPSLPGTHAVYNYLYKPVRRSVMSELLSTIGTSAAQVLPPPIDDDCNEVLLTGHVLVAEDQVINREIVLDMLEAAGLSATAVDNGRDAVDLFASSETHFDLILMDCQMPELDGFAATAEIRRLEQARDRHPHTPIIALTAHALQGVKERCLAAGMDDYLTKPISMRVLHASAARWLAPRAAEQKTGTC